MTGHRVKPAVDELDRVERQLAAALVIARARRPRVDGGLDPVGLTYVDPIAAPYVFGPTDRGPGRRSARKDA